MIEIKPIKSVTKKEMFIGTSDRVRDFIKKNKNEKMKKERKSFNKKKTEELGEYGNGGYRPGSGRKSSEEKEVVRNLIEKINTHGNELVEVQMGGKIEKKERVLILLHKLFELGAQGNIEAIKEYFNRVLGKSKETMDMKANVTLEDLMLEQLRRRREMLKEAEENSNCEDEDCHAPMVQSEEPS